MKNLFIVLSTVIMSVVLVGCQEDDSTATDTDTNVNQDQAEVESPPLPTEDDASNVDSGEQAENDSSSADTGEQATSNPLKETTYATEQEAIDAMGEIQSFDETNLDLGHGIKAWEEGAAGHDYITWKEGNWTIQIDYPNDPEYALPGYEKGQDVAKAMVDYLEKNYLPAPDKVGVIRVTGFNQHPETSIQWQVGKTLKQLYVKTDDPLEALEIAVNSN
ncbi:hypothetical protein [Paenisporosarcina cavernae]|uniref:Lipoprotein n=1 Tax=Paenisporosarcina cavernae TaxID=2320858 RepID=A0A385YRT7_9BACL|nr:hypothetical protein [Paenisporosarcina cavernae]AYC28458.1 hypothetical protein D3873_00695 [Paenisporosarcina cavernae]